MIKLLLLDFGETLVHDGRPFPGVADALAVLSEFSTDAGERLVLAVLSDFGTPGPATTESQVRASEAEFAAVLDASTLGPFFRPFDRRVTISARARAAKPDRRAFDAAARRSGTAAALEECLFVTENATHLRAARDVGLATLGFGRGDGADWFSDWADAPAVVAVRVSPENLRDRERAVGLPLRTRYGIENFKCLTRRGPDLQGQGVRLVRLDRPDLGELDGAFVKLSSDVSVKCDNAGAVREVRVSDPEADDINDAIAYVRSLAANDQIAAAGGPPGPNATHAVDTDDDGRRVIVRRHFSG